MVLPSDKDVVVMVTMRRPLNIMDLSSVPLTKPVGLS